MSDYSENMDFSPTRQAKIAACEKLRDAVIGISALHKSLLDESLARSPSPRNSFTELYRMNPQAMAMKKEEMVSELKTLPPCTRTDCNEHKIPTTLVVEEINSNGPISDEKTECKVKKKKLSKKRKNKNKESTEEFIFLKKTARPISPITTHRIP
ncbi:hypothetical protein TNIN_106581 [Trichonephila inaurata madagascariensis]|uniref:Uncharacterized protein n=1 Tax=Trichonephila inaurata madagascariensis TaxID=2747483 RepID=A0A8X6X9S6_9ARAC|nr:hypothetical protein TNIN_106581 [Trichonephila inaurata madagascariensis]